MPTATNSVSISAGGMAIQRTVNRTGDGLIAQEITLPAAVAGTLTTRTDNDTGVITVASHSITASDTVNVFWSGGRRYNVDVTAVTGTTISIDIGSGDNLPASSTAVTIVKETLINVLIDGDSLSLLAISMETSDTSLTTKGFILFEDAAGDDILALDLTANSPRTYDITGGDTNSFTGDVITTARAANANSSTAATLKILGVYDATP